MSTPAVIPARQLPATVAAVCVVAALLVGCAPLTTGSGAKPKPPSSAPVAAAPVATPGPTAGTPATTATAGTVVATTASAPAPAPAPAKTVDASGLVAAVNDGAPGATVVVAPGIYELTEPLRPKSGMTIRGAGTGVTTIRNAASWAPGTAGLDTDEGATRSSIDCSSYLIDLGEKAAGVTLTAMTLSGPQLHGGVCGFDVTGLALSGLEFNTFLWSGVRAFGLAGSTIDANSFVDAGGRSGVTTGSSGGGLFLTYTSDTEISNNRFTRTAAHPDHYYGIKGREARDVRIHHNTIQTDFAIEFPFESDWSVEIDHNYLGGAISVPKYEGGVVPAGGYTFHVHHNYMTASYAFEMQRNGMEIDHNLFDFATAADGGNLFSGFDAVPALVGGTRMHNNLIRNPGRGLYWSEGVYNNFSFYNNHVRGETTVTPRTEGLFDFRPGRDGVNTDWGTIAIRDNIVELTGTPRPLLRNAESRAGVIENNTLTNISDAAALANPDTGRPRGPLEPLAFRLGAGEEYAVDGWTLSGG